MKKRILIIIAAAAALAYAADWQITVPAETSYIIAPQLNLRADPDPWEATTAVDQGELVLSGGRRYMALHAGTTGETPPEHQWGVASDDSVTWLRVRPNRTFILVSQESNAQIWYHDGTTATNAGGVFAFAKGQTYGDTSANAISVWSDTEVKLSIKER